MTHQPLSHAEKHLLRKKYMEAREVVRMIAQGAQLNNPIGFAHHMTILLDLLEREAGFDDPSSVFGIAEQGE